MISSSEKDKLKLYWASFPGVNCDKWNKVVYIIGKFLDTIETYVVLFTSSVRLPRIELSLIPAEPKAARQHNFWLTNLLGSARLLNLHFKTRSSSARLLKFKLKSFFEPKPGKYFSPTCYNAIQVPQLGLLEYQLELNSLSSARKHFSSNPAQLECIHKLARLVQALIDLTRLVNRTKVITCGTLIW